MAKTLYMLTSILNSWKLLTSNFQIADWLEMMSSPRSRPTLDSRLLLHLRLLQLSQISLSFTLPSLHIELLFLHLNPVDITMTTSSLKSSSQALECLHRWWIGESQPPHQMIHKPCYSCWLIWAAVVCQQFSWLSNNTSETPWCFKVDWMGWMDLWLGWNIEHL